MDGIKRVKTANAKTRRRVQKSTTLNRKFVKQPRKIQTGGSKQVATKQAAAKKVVAKSAAGAAAAPKKAIQQRQVATFNKAAKARTANKFTQMERGRTASLGSRQLSAQELKERAIEQALNNAKANNSRQNIRQVMEKQATLEKKSVLKRKGVWATALAIVLAVGAIGAFVYLNLPDLTVKVAALRNGFDGRFPSYLPQGYESDGVDVKDGKIIMKFRNGGKTFRVEEEKSTWDSATVRGIFVEKEWGQDYEIMKGQGLTIYVADEGAAWVNGGILYKIFNENSDLTKEQIHGLAVGL